MSKKKVPVGWVKISEFEKLTGLNNRTVSLAISRGKIPAKLVKQIGTGATSPKYIDPQQAGISWYNNLNANHHLSQTLRESLAKYIRKFDPAAIGEEKKTKKKEAEQPTGEMKLAEAQRRERVAKAKIAELELLEKEGSLVQKSLVYDQLFAAGQELRNALLAIPDRITDQVIAASGNRTKALNIIYDAIAAELGKLADIQKQHE